MRGDLTPQSPPILKMEGIVKSFGAVKALRNGTLTLQAGEVHVLFGENGAGKSTLINVISGVLRQDDGTYQLDGASVRFGSVQEARAHGIAAMFQEFSLAPDLTVAENLFLGREPGRFGLMNRRKITRLARETLARYEFKISPHALVGHLGRAEQQMVEMAKALSIQPRILILDEPTASLSERETNILFETVRRLRDDGVAIIYITHRMREITEIADRITVMRDGAFVATLAADEADHDRLIELMTGRKVTDLYPVINHHPSRLLLRMEHVTSADGRVQDASLEVYEGEIVGLAGLVGCGKSEIGRLCYGLGGIASGALSFNDEVCIGATPRGMLARGLGYITSNRRGEGLLLQRSMRENIDLAALGQAGLSRFGVIKTREDERLTRTLAQRVSVRPLDMSMPSGNFSGGNQQKIIIARALARGARLLVFDEPTVGVDVNARSEVYRELAALIHEGHSILLISSDMPEIMNLCHRVYVVSEGRIVDHIQQSSEITETRLLRGYFAQSAAQPSSAPLHGS